MRPVLHVEVINEPIFMIYAMDNVAKDPLRIQNLNSFGSENQLWCERWQYLLHFQLKLVIWGLICMHYSLWTHLYDSYHRKLLGILQLLTLYSWARKKPQLWAILAKVGYLRPMLLSELVYEQILQFFPRKCYQRHSRTSKIFALIWKSN